MAKLVLDEPKTKPKLVLDEPPDFGMAAIPKERLPGVWDYDKQLDQLLGDPEIDIEKTIPLDARFDFGRIVGMTEKPDETKDKMASSLFYSVQFGIPPSVSFSILDELNKIAFDGKIPASTAWGRIKQRYRTGKSEVQLMDMGFDILKGTWQDWEKYDRSVKNIEKLQSGMTIDQRKEFRGFFEKLVGASAELTPFGLEAAKEMPMGAAIGGTLFGIAAALTTAAIPTIGEEIPAITAATLTGIKVGAGVRGAMRVGQLEAGGQFLELARMKDQYGNRIDPRIAVVASHAVGAINGGIELAEWTVLLGTFGIGKKLFDKSVRKVTHRLLTQGTLKELIARKALDYSVALGAETIQEIEQETTNIVFGELAKELNNAREGTDFKPITGDDLKARYQEITVESMRAFGLMVLPGTTVSGALELVAQKKEAAAKPVGKPGVVEVKAVTPPTEAEQAPDKPVAGRKAEIAPVTQPEGGVADMTLDELKKESAGFDKKIETEKARLDKIAPERQRFGDAGITYLSQEDVARYTEINYEIARREGLSQTEAKERVAEKRAARLAKAEGIEPTKLPPTKLADATIALRLKDGTVISDPKATHHGDLILKKKIDVFDVQDVGWIDRGEYVTHIPITSKTKLDILKEGKTLQPVAKAEPKTLQEMSDAELLEKRRAITVIDKKRRKPQQIKELQEIEGELVGRHQPGESDISQKTRNIQIKETAESIKNEDLYRDAEQALGERYQALPLKKYSIARNKADIPGEVKDYIGKPGEKGYKGYLWNYLTTLEESPHAIGYDEALDAIGGRPGDIGEFIARLDEVVQQQKGVEGVVNQTALDEAVATGEPYIELLAMKYEMLKEGFAAQEINDTIKKWAQDNEVDAELIEKDFVPVEGKQDVRTKQEILRGLEKESPKVTRRKAAPEEAAIKKAHEVARKTKQPQYVYEKTGKDVGLFTVSNKPPIEGKYRKVAPPIKSQVVGEITEGFVGMTPEEKVGAKKLRQKIHAIAINKGLTKKALSELKLKHTGYRKLTGKVSKAKITTEQLQNLLKAVQKARPKRVGYKRVITRKTEKKIQSLKENLIKKTQMTEKHFAEILEKEVHGKEPKYIDAKKFITETEGKDIIRRTLDEAKVIELTESFERAIAKNPEIAERVKSLDSRIEKASKRDPYSLESMRFYNQQAEVLTGAPIFTAYMDLMDTHLEVTRTRTARLKKLENIVSEFKDIAKDNEALQRVSDYIASQTALKEKPAMPENITADEIKLAKGIQKILEEYQLPARFTRFYWWWSTGKQEGPHPLPDYEQYKTEINKAVDIYESKGEEELIEYLRTQEWGVIKSGYEPLEILFHKIRPYKTGSTMVGKGHIKIRTDIEYHKQERNILQRLSAYMRQMDMLYNLSPKINAYIRLFDDNASKFKDWGKVKGDIEIFLRNLKRYNIEGGFFERNIARAYSQAMRVIIMPSPVLSFRNLFQNAAFEHDKSILIDPRNTKLTDKDIEYLETYILQTRAMVEEYFMIGEKPLPMLNTLTKLIDKVKIYPYSDIANRHWSFWAKTNQVDRAIKAETIKQMMTEAKFEDMKELEQRRALAILARDGKEAMSQYVGRVHVDDVHFLYERSQRSPAEMTSLGKIVGNLMLFPRAYGEKLAHAANKMLKGKTYEEQWRGLKTLFAVIGGGLIVGSIYMKVTGRKRNPYNPLDILAFRPGGLAWGSIEAATEIYANILSAAKGDSRALAALTIAIPRAADMFIPFYDYTLRAIEAATDQKNIDRRVLRQIRMMIDKEYKIRGGAYKVNRTALEKWQYFLSGPSAEPKEEEPKDFGGAKE